jgi:small subunit ribosomal protein S20
LFVAIAASDAGRWRDAGRYRDRAAAASLCCRCAAGRIRKGRIAFFVDRTRRAALKPGPGESAADGMANHKSAEKRIRQIEKRTAINRSRLSRVRTFVKKVETAIASGDKASAETALRLAQPELHRAITKGVMHKNTVSRKLSRLATRINAL